MYMFLQPASKKQSFHQITCMMMFAKREFSNTSTTVIRIYPTISNWNYRSYRCQTTNTSVYLQRRLTARAWSTPPPAPTRWWLPPAAAAPSPSLSAPTFTPPRCAKPGKTSQTTRRLRQRLPPLAEPDRRPGWVGCRPHQTRCRGFSCPPGPAHGKGKYISSEFFYVRTSGFYFEHHINRNSNVLEVA